MTNKYIKNRVQIFNPKGKHWVKIDTRVGKIIGHKKIPYKSIKKRYSGKSEMLKKVKKRKPKYCCEMMKYAMGEAKVIRWSVLPAIGGVEIDYCPWCRKKLKTIFEAKK